MKFKYKGQSKDRQRVQGELEATDKADARSQLRAMQVRASLLEPIKEGSSSGGSKKRKGKQFDFDIRKLNEISIGPPVDLKGMILFTRQFSSLIDAGVPVVQCLNILAEQERRPPFRKILFQIKETIEGGKTLATAMSAHPSAFSSMIVSLIEAGEVSGTLDKTLRRIGVQMEKTAHIRKKVKGAMIYPAITLVIAIVVLVGLLVKVIPEVAKMYGDNSELPELTLMVLNLSEWVQSNYMTGFGYLVGGVVSGMILYRIPAFRKYWDPFILRVPGFGPLIKKSSIARLSRTMSTLISSGVPLLGAFDICRKIVNNQAIQKVITDTANGVSEGKSIAYGFGRNNVFPPMMVHMVSIGEVSGKLDELMGKIADIYEEEVDEAVSALTGLVNPMMMVGVGGIIGFLLVAMYLPIFQLADKVAG